MGFPMLPSFAKASLRVLTACTGLAAACGAALLILTGCPGAPPPAPKAPLTARAAAPVRWQVYTARREADFVPLDLPVIVAGSKISIGSPLRMVRPGELTLMGAAADSDASTATDERVPVPADWPQGEFPALYSVHLQRSAAEGPLAEQLTGQPRATTDAGSYLVALTSHLTATAAAKAPAATATSAASEPSPAPPAVVRTFDVSEPMPLYVHVEVPAGIDPGEYRFPVRLEVPGRPVEDVMLAVRVTELAVPTQPRVLAIATTTMAELRRMYPASFGDLSGERLDRGDPDQKAAVEQLDALVRAAHQQGVALFVEDATPGLHVDEVGHVSVDWDAYDRLMQPYMDGSAFEDRVPLPAWLAPVPPRRIRDSGTQLWQYIDACARHFATKGWVGTPAFLHPALADPELPEDADADTPSSDDAALRSLVSEMLRLHMPREMLAVSTPDAVAEGVPHGELWTINDSDPRLPPAGALASEFSLRSWPWVCVARDKNGATGPVGEGSVKGFVWRDALATDRESAEANSRALFVSAHGAILPTLRMAWLHEGLNDAALLGMLEQQTDPAAKENILEEILAGMIGRTGAPAPSPPPPATAPASAEALTPQILLPPTATPGFLYAAWPGNRAAWSQVTPMLQKLILAGDPGTRSSIRADDPDYLAAKIWLGQTRRPAGRVAGYSFSVRPGRESDILDARLRLRIENPIDAAAEVNLRFSDLPGDFDLPPDVAPATSDAAAGLPVDSGTQVRQRTATLPPGAAGMIVLPLAGHVESLMKSPPASTLEVTEQFAGTTLRMPVQFPIYRMHATDAPPKCDGNGSDWPTLEGDPQTRVFGEMMVSERYLARPDLSSGVIRRDGSPAICRWMYDRNYLYILARCPQDAISDQRNTDWPTVQTGAGGPESSPQVRWWGTDGLQIELSAMPPSQYLTGPLPPTAPGAPAVADPFNRVVKIAFKPAGVMLVQTGTLSRNAQTGATQISWHDGAPVTGAVAGNIRYGISVQKRDGRPTGYTVEAAIPRAWIDPPGGGQFGTKAPAWRVNVLRHRASDLASMSWAGPVADDNDLGMMGALLGE